jgi:hypothetical protein
MMNKKNRKLNRSGAGRREADREGVWPAGVRGRRNVTIAKRLELAFKKAGQDEDLLWALCEYKYSEARFMTVVRPSEEVRLPDGSSLFHGGIVCYILSDGSVVVLNPLSKYSKIEEAAPDVRLEALRTMLERYAPEWGSRGKDSRAFLRAALRGEPVYLRHPAGEWVLVES